MVWETVVDGPSWYLERQTPNLDIKWDQFVADVGTKSSKAAVSREFEAHYRNVVVKWEGQVLRVEGDNIDSTDVLGQEVTE